jgi:hypothetical protein
MELYCTEGRLARVASASTHPERTRRPAAFLSLRRRRSSFLMMRSEILSEI